MLNPINCILKNIAKTTNFIIYGVIFDIDIINSLYSNKNIFLIIQNNDNIKNNIDKNIYLAPDNVTHLPYELTPNVILIDNPHNFDSMMSLSNHYQIPLAVIFNNKFWSNVRKPDIYVLQESLPKYANGIIFDSDKNIPLYNTNNIKYIDKNNLLQSLQASSKIPIIL